jgi:hypothetical protein
MISNLIKRFTEWRKQKHFKAEHKFFIRTTLEQDSRWLANDRTASVLIQRYKDITAHDWYTRPHEDISTLRDRLGLDPNVPKKPAAIVTASVEEIDGRLCRIKTIKFLEDVAIGQHLYTE